MMTSGNGTGYKLDNADQSFDDRKNAPLFTATPDPNQKRDGQWFAELLGVDPALFTGIHASGGQDQMRTRAMQRALWPATVGYWMDKLLTPEAAMAGVGKFAWHSRHTKRCSWRVGRAFKRASSLTSQPTKTAPTAPAHPTY